MTRVGLAVCVATVMVVAVAGPARAHGAGGGQSDASNYLSRVTDVVSQDGPVGEIEDLDWQVLASDALLKVSNPTDAEVVVYGYDDEPYLRIGPSGVLVNRNSPARYLNEDRYAQTPVPEHADPAADPDWTRVAGDSSYAWHDHRIHWMAVATPPRVQADPGQTVRILDWEVPFTWDGREAFVMGDLQWIPPPPWQPWVLAALAGLTLPLVVALALGRGPGRRRRVVLRTAAVLVAAVVAIDVVHAIDDLLAVPATLTEDLLAGAQSAAFIAIGAFGARASWRGRDGAATGLAIGVAALVLGIGVAHLEALTSSQIVSLLPDSFARIVTALNLSLALPGLMAVYLSGDLRMLHEQAEAVSEPAAQQP